TRDPWGELVGRLRARLGELRDAGASAFRDTRQAETILKLVFDEVLPAYRTHHADLLFHLSNRDLLQPFFVARVIEAVLTRGPLAEEPVGLVPAVLKQLNDFVGHRPIAVLESRPKGEPYPHERVRPVPLFIRPAGVAPGPYQGLVTLALEILGDTDSGILADAYFEPEHLDELAVDPRA